MEESVAVLKMVPVGLYSPQESCSTALFLKILMREEIGHTHTLEFKRVQSHQATSVSVILKLLIKISRSPLLAPTLPQPLKKFRSCPSTTSHRLHSISHPETDP